MSGQTQSGTDGNDTLNGTGFADSLSGLGGNDRLEGFQGNDSLNGGEGDDTLNGGGGNDSLVGGNGNDVFIGGAGADTADYSANTALQAINLTNAAGTITGTDGLGGNDSLSTVEAIFGGAGADTVNLAGLTTAATLVGGNGNDSLVGGDGNDRLAGGSDADTVFGGNGADTLWDESGNDWLDGGVGADSINTFTGADTVFGGADNDTISASVGSDGDRLSGDGGDDRITGGAGGDTISGGEGADTILAQAGADTINGGADNDSINGGTGTGNDIASYADASGGVQVNLVTGLATGAAGNDTLVSIEGVLGSAHDDMLTGGGGNDLLDGGEGADSLQAGTGRDTVLGGGGADTILANTQGDVSNGSDSLDGGAGNDSILGGGRGTATDPNTLLGGIGDDTIVAGGGADFIQGGLGDDRITTGSGADTLSYADAPSGVSVNMTEGIVLGGGGQDSITIGGNVLLVASGHNDTLFADSRQKIDGGAGNDLFREAYSGDDGSFAYGASLDGGAGTDRLAFNKAGFYQISRGTGGEVTISYLGNATEAGAVDGDPLTAKNFEEFRYDNNAILNLTAPDWTDNSVFYVCFAAGTRILTATGDVAVEALQPGDAVVTLAGRGLPVKPVLWVGRRHVVLAGRADAAEMAPIRIKAGALGVNTPKRDLVVSPDHCLYLDGALVPARLLVNGRSVVAETGMAEVTWYHVELETHEVLVAEGAVAESWLDCGNRSWFQNAPVALLTVPGNLDTVGTGFDASRACAPLVHGGEKLAAIRASLDSRAGQRAEAAPPARMAL